MVKAGQHNDWNGYTANCHDSNISTHGLHDWAPQCSCNAFDRSATRRRLFFAWPQCSTHHPDTPANPIIPTLAARNYERADAELKLIPRLSICSRKASTSRQRSLQAAHAAMSEEYVHTSGCSPPACNCCIMTCASSKFPARAARRPSLSLSSLLAAEARPTNTKARARPVHCLIETSKHYGRSHAMP